MIRKYSQLKTASVGSDMNRRAIKEFGTTSDPESIGFITPEGLGIDSSGETRGSRQRGRNIDHREIAQAGIGEEVPFPTLHALLNHFMAETGNIRVVTAREEVNIQVPLKRSIPTGAQFKVLEKLCAGKPVIWDITDKTGHILSTGNGKYFTFLNDLTRVRKQERDISADKAAGKIPRQLKPLADFVSRFETLEDYKAVHYESKHPLHPQLLAAEAKTGLGVTKTWDDFGFNSMADFFRAVKGSV